VSATFYSDGSVFTAAARQALALGSCVRRATHISPWFPHTAFCLVSAKQGRRGTRVHHVSRTFADVAAARTRRLRHRHPLHRPRALAVPIA